MLQLKHRNKLRNLRIQDRIDGINSISFTICRIHHQSLPSTYVYDEQYPVVTNNIFMSECINGLEITKYNLLYKCFKIIPTLVRQENQSILQYPDRLKNFSRVVYHHIEVFPCHSDHYRLFVDHAIHTLLRIKKLVRLLQAGRLLPQHPSFELMLIDQYTIL